ncbi:phosphatidylserine decarboxylase proenzyme [Pochonia chlamydosporia 170]|uniref:phosphatidylserine decarboxylase n=1 Tax=Pochonia chlamydosporia 170 TaxID=1380566 RepID=A0A179F1D3_METCM|nr:phosphatidylserine decarboxylase proenzyme [Pochonia chlamydosporia 170]OAQ59265.1 phosphatidylserine decarboxylase proenzyme [Pochonia chlamydosporia 170]
MNVWQRIHQIADYLLSWVKLEQNAEVGWRSFNRKTGQLEREQQTLWKKLKLVILFNPLMEWMDRTHLMRLYMHEESVAEGRRERTTASRKRIKAFVDSYGINMRDFEPADVNCYPTFEDFFTRAHRPGSRPIYETDDPSRAVVVADSRVVVFDSITEAKALWIKGKNFSLNNLVMNNEIGDKFKHAAIASFRLSPQDYHRYHSPVQGTIQSFQSLPGDYYQVDPVALQSNVDILTRNRRDFVVIKTKEFGEVLFVAIGATDVGSVQIHKKYQHIGETVKKGDELGVFQFGGSSIIVAFQYGLIKFDDDLSGLSEQKIQTSVEVGMSLGSSKEKS